MRACGMCVECECHYVIDLIYACNVDSKAVRINCTRWLELGSRNRHGVRSKNPYRPVPLIH